MMNRTQLFKALIFTSVLSALTSTPVLAQTHEQARTVLPIFQFNPPDSGMPGSTVGGASRSPDSCRQQDAATRASNIVLLAPTSFVGLTVAERPAFFLYAEQTSAKRLFISIQDAANQLHYQGFHDLATDTGLIRVELPPDMPALKADQTYRLSVAPLCGDSLRPDDPVLTGYIQRISDVPVADSVATQPSFVQAMRYAELGIWYDTLTLLAPQLQDQSPDESLRAAWESLLISGGLIELIPHADTLPHTLYVSRYVSRSHE